MKNWFFTLVLVAVFTGIISAQPVKRLYLANDDHTDYMWSGNVAKYDSAFVHMLDFYLRQIDSTKNNPDDYQARFNCDGSYWLKAYQTYRSKAQFDHLIERIRDGHISSPLNSLVNTYGAQPTEAVLRGMFYAGRLEREYHLKFNLAVAMENQTLPLGLSSLWAGAGAKYSWRGVCGCASRISNASLANRLHQIYYYTGQDSSKILMKWYDRAIFNGRTLGGYAETRREKDPGNASADMSLVVQALDQLCDTINTKSKYPYNVAGAFGYGWDDLQTFNSKSFIEAAKLYSSPKLKIRVSNEEDFFQDMEKSYKRLPAISASYGNEWDTYCTSMNETTAKVRRATEMLRPAEALYSLVALKDAVFGKDLTTARQKAWDGFGAYWEHDWTADAPSVSQRERADWQIGLQKDISNYVDTLFTRSKLRLGSLMKKAVYPRFYVFNCLSWMRSDVAYIPYKSNKAVKVIDISTGKETMSQSIVKDGNRFIRIYAESIPSIGYKTYEVRPGAAKASISKISVSGEFLSNAYYKLRLRKSGVITSLLDKKANRELVKKIDGKYLNDLGTPNLDDGNSLKVENAGPVSVTLKATASRPLLRTVRITLFSNSPRIDIEDSIQQNFSNVQQISFSLNLQNQTTRHEELAAVLTVKKHSRGGDYADQNARYDWQTFNHFADMSERNYGVSISNQDCSFFRLGKSTPDSLWESSTQLNALAGGQVDPYTLHPTGWKDTVMMGIYNQDGQKEFSYHFSLQTHNGSFNYVDAMKFSLEHQNPLVAAEVTGNASVYPDKRFSFLNISDPKVLLWSLKPSEEGINNGLITRFWNMSSTKKFPVVNLPNKVNKVYQTTHIETDIAEVPLNNHQFIPGLDARGLKSYRLKF